MTVNVVITVCNRPQLTHQSLWSLAKNTDIDYNVVIVDDASHPETWEMLRMFCGTRKNAALLRIDTTKGIVGAAKNLGAYWAERYWGRGEWLHMCDNDCFFTPGWAGKLVEGFAAMADMSVPMWLLGGQNHPYHHPVNTWQRIPVDGGGGVEVREYYAVAGTSQLMTWEAWDRFGPLDANAAGTCQSEDTAFCNRIRAAGGKVGAVWPHVVIDTGISQTDGSPSVGAEHKEKVEGVLYL